jgi:hypothetical protein
MLATVRGGVQVIPAPSADKRWKRQIGPTECLAAKGEHLELAMLRLRNGVAVTPYRRSDLEPRGILGIAQNNDRKWNQESQDGGHRRVKRLDPVGRAMLKKAHTGTCQEENANPVFQ